MNWIYGTEKNPFFGGVVLLSLLKNGPLPYQQPGSFVLRKNMLCSASRQRKINVWPQRSSPWIAIRVQDRTLALLCAVKLLPCCSSSGSPALYSLLATYTDMSLILLSNGSFEDACQDRGRGWSRLYSPMNLHLEEFSV